MLNQITSRGHTVRAGAIIFTGALGPVHAGQPGHYRAEFGELGTVEFELRP